MVRRWPQRAVAPRTRKRRPPGAQCPRPPGPARTCHGPPPRSVGGGPPTSTTNRQIVISAMTRANRSAARREKQHIWYMDRSRPDQLRQWRRSRGRRRGPAPCRRGWGEKHHRGVQGRIAPRFACRPVAQGAAPGAGRTRPRSAGPWPGRDGRGADAGGRRAGIRRRRRRGEEPGERAHHSRQRHGPRSRPVPLIAGAGHYMTGTRTPNCRPHHRTYLDRPLTTRPGRPGRQTSTETDVAGKAREITRSALRGPSQAHTPNRPRIKQS